MKWFLSLFAASAIHGDSIPAGPLAISPEGKALIVEFETGGQAYYRKALAKPSWPGGASGVTVGIGYDCGYNSRQGILDDWQALPESQRNALASAAGVKGIAAKSRASALRWIVVSWETAETVFVGNTMPRFGRMTDTAFPCLTKTHGHVQGAMLSIVFNRGASMSGDGRREMRQIRTLIAAGNVRGIPPQVRSMKRLWYGKGLDGLIRRREAEAKLIERSLSP